MFMTPRVVTDWVTTWTGAAMPISIGPTDNPSPTVFNRLKAMFAESRDGATSRLALPVSFESGRHDREYSR